MSPAICRRGRADEFGYEIERLLWGGPRNDGRGGGKHWRPEPSAGKVRRVSDRLRNR
jgi:hypothetical protein